MPGTSENPQMILMMKRTPWYAAAGGLLGAIIGALLMCLFHCQGG